MLRRSRAVINVARAHFIRVRRYNGRAERRVRRIIGRARDAPHNLQWLKRDEKPAPQVCEESQFAIAARERVLTPRGFEVRADARQ